MTNGYRIYLDIVTQKEGRLPVYLMRDVKYIVIPVYTCIH